MDDVKASKNNALRPAADLTQQVRRQFKYHLLLIVSFDLVFGDFEYLLHCSPVGGN